MPILIGGEPTTLIPDADRVALDIRFKPGTNRNTRARKTPPRVIVHHWTGAENPGRRVVQTLLRRELSIHFVGEKNGDLTQHADIMTRCAHAGAINDRSIGFEWVSRGFARKEDLRGEDLRERTTLDWAEPRDVYRDVLSGKGTNMVSFYPEAVEAMLWSTETLCGLLLIPRQQPYKLISERPPRSTIIARERLRQIAVPDGMGKWAVPAFDRDPRGRYWPPSGNNRALRFEGVLGHFHVHKSKWDPGTQFFYALWAEGFNPKGRKLFGWKQLIA